MILKLAVPLAVLLSVLSTSPALASNTSAFLSGTVTQNGKPVGGARVSATGNNRTYKTTTDKRGHFAFPPFGVGT